jgi:hypothetical protein
MKTAARLYNWLWPASAWVRVKPPYRPGAARQESLGQVLMETAVTLAVCGALAVAFLTVISVIGRSVAK